MTNETVLETPESKPKAKGPIQFRADDDLRAKMEKIAEVNGVSFIDVGNLCLKAGIPIVEVNFDRMHHRKPAKKKKAD